MPALLIVGAAAWKLTLSNPGLTARGDSGPMRLDLADFKECKLSPFEVSQGYDWGARGSIQVKGKADLSSSLKSFAIQTGPTLYLAYRRGKEWQRAVGPKPSVMCGYIGAVGEFPVNVKLDDVPVDADEVRLRGNFRLDLIYQGTVPSAWKRPSNFKMSGQHPSLVLTSKPFDILVERKDQVLVLSMPRIWQPLRQLWMVKRHL